MNPNKRWGLLFIPHITTIIAISILASGCTSPTATGTSSSNQSTAAPAAKPGAKIGENNPAPGQPNHMSPEMQAQMQRYQDAAKK